MPSHCSRPSHQATGDAAIDAGRSEGNRDISA